MSSTHDPHPDRELLERFLDDTLDPAECRAVERHLFTCPPCEERLIALLPAADWSVGEDEGLLEERRPSLLLRLEPNAGAPDDRGLGRRVVDRMQPGLAEREALLDRDRIAAAADWRAIEAEAPGRRRELIAGSPRFHRWGLFELLLERARQIGSMGGSPVDGRAPEREDLHRARELLLLAIAVAERLDAATYGPGSVAAALTRAWAQLGDARRALADFDGAEEAFDAAEMHLAASWRDPLDEALILELKAGLRRAQRRFAEAVTLLDGAIALSREVHEPQLQGRSRIAQGLVRIDAREPARAAEHFESGLFLIDAQLEPRLLLIAQQSLVYCLHESGQGEEAQMLIEEADHPESARGGRGLSGERRRRGRQSIP